MQNENVEYVALQPKRKKAKVATRDDLWVEANANAQTWANCLQDLPIPAFEGQIKAMKVLIEAARTNKAVSIGENITS